MESNDDEDDCVITNVIEKSEKALLIKVEEPVLKKCKVENEEFIEIIPGDGHCIANCFARHFKEPLDKVLDRLDSEFRQNITFYKDFSLLSEDDIIEQLYAYITEKTYNNGTVDLFLHAFSNIYNTKVIVKHTDEDTPDNIIGNNFANVICLSKEPDHFNLIRNPELKERPVGVDHKPTDLEKNKG